MSSARIFHWHENEYQKRSILKFKPDVVITVISVFKCEVEFYFASWELGRAAEIELALGHAAEAST